MTVNPDALRMARERHCDRGENGEWVCGRITAEGPCGKPVVDATVFCGEHDQEHRAYVAARHKREVDQARADALQRLAEAPIWQELPTLPFDESRAGPALTSMVQRYDPLEHGSVLIIGPPGTWKSSTLVATMRRLRTTAESWIAGARLDDLRLSGRNPYAIVRGAYWTSGLRLLRAHRSGWSEPKEVERAKSAPLLLLDELGPQTRGDTQQVIHEVLEARHDNGNLPTLATSGMTERTFVEAHGGGVWRRLAGEARGRCISTFPVEG